MTVRWRVFVEEQGVAPVLEIDGRDFLESTVQLVALDGDNAIGSARVAVDHPESGADPQFNIGRVAVLHENRGEGIGALLIQAAEQAAVAASPFRETIVVTLDAQVQASGFYERLGYRPTERSRFLDAGIEHQEMRKQISLSKSSSDEDK